MAQRLVTSLESERTSDRFQALWKVIMKVSTDLFIEPSRKRSVWRQQNRSNPPVVDTESYYRVAYYFALVDHTLSHLKTRFPPELATFLLPGNTSIFPTRQLLTSSANLLITFLTHRASKLRWLRGKST